MPTVYQRLFASVTGYHMVCLFREPEAAVDLQLPEQHQPRVQAAAPREKARIVFRQKTVASLGAGGETFKKRRAEGEKRRNIRQRTDE